MRVMEIGTNEGEITVRYISGELESFQSIVGGYIEPAAPVQLRQQGIEMLVNEEGLMRGLPANVNLFPFFFVGTVVMVGFKDDTFVSLSNDQQAYIMKWLKSLEG